MKWQRLSVRRGRARRLLRGWPVLLGVAGMIISNCSFFFRKDPSLWSAFIAAGSLLVAGACILAVVRVLRAWRDEIRKAAGWREFRCERCGFDLRGSTNGQCPECGAENAKFAKLIGVAGPRLLEKARSGTLDG